MWRFYYSIVKNIIRMPKIISGMRCRIEHPEKYSEEDCYEYIRYIVNLMKKTGHIRTEGYGMEKLPKEGRYMMYPNHQGKYDAYGIVSVHEKPCTVVMDKAKSNVIFIREIIDMLKGKRMDLNDTRQALKVIEEIAKEVAVGRRYVLFPEGGYTKEKKKQHDGLQGGMF